VVAWAVSDHVLLKELLTDPRVSKDPRQHWPKWINGEITPEWPLFTWVAVTNMFTAYGSDHRRLRKLVSTAFTPRRIEALRPRIERLTADLLDGLAATPRGETVDLREGYCYPIPVQVICELVGIADSAMRKEFGRLVDSVFHTTAGPEEVAATFADMHTVMSGLIALKRRTPGEDMTSVLIAAREEDGSRLASTSASVPHWPGWKPRSPCPPSSSASRTWRRPSRRTSCFPWNPSSPTATGACPSA
jgi:cytochrome P450